MAERTRISELERCAGSSSRYLGRIDESWGRRSQCREQLGQLREFLRERGIDPGLLAPFSKGGEGGVVYFELPLGAREFHSQATHLLLDCCRQEVLGQPDEKLWDKWREFGQNLYYGTVEDLYLNFCTQAPGLALAFELGYRKLMAESSAAWWEGQTARVKARRPEITQRFLLELNGLIRPFRQAAAQKHGFDLKVFERFSDLGWEMDMDPARPRAVDFVCQLREKGLTPWLLGELFPLLYQEQIKSQEEIIWETLKSSSFSKPEEMTAVIGGRLPRVSEQALREIQKMLAKRAGELEARVSQELAELQKFSARVKKQTQELISQNNGEMTRVVETRLYSENLANLTARITDTQIQFQRGLTGQLWYLQDLDRKERNLQGVIERCQYLARIPPAELQAMLTSKSGDQGTDILEHIAQYKLLQKKLGQGWDQWTKARGKQLADLIKAALEQPQPKEAKAGAEGHREADRRSLNLLVEETGGKRAYHVERLTAAYRSFISDQAELLINYGRLAGMIRLWPPPLTRTPPVLRQQEMFDEVRFLSDGYRQGESYFLFSAQGPILPRKSGAGMAPADPAKAVRKHARTATVLVYDIRGSSFMSAKLRNAEKEREVKNKLGYLVAQAIRQHGGFLVKDTGDGGVAWFGENAGELYDKCYKEVTTGKGLRLRHSIGSGAEVTMLPSAESAAQALSCSASMLRLAETFIQDNFNSYREWFREAKEREILYEGMSYAVLPPEFKALFRIGIGVASGQPGRDLTLSLNALGDMDLCGTLVNDASLLAGGRDPSHSTILADHATCFNLMLNSERFSSSYLHQFWEAKAEGPDAWETKLRESAALAETVLPDGSYHFPGPGLAIRRAGYHYSGRSGISKEHSLELEPEDQCLDIHEDARLVAGDNCEVRVVYEVQPSEAEKP
ncbi:MAG TPA: hypothetical protein DDW31_04030 [candidate division Zixibacteria bacterium]|nr:hypothetical protein [candidate division Zixibacteria bacterium]